MARCAFRRAPRLGPVRLTPWVSTTDGRLYRLLRAGQAAAWHAGHLHRSVATCSHRPSWPDRATTDGARRSSGPSGPLAHPGFASPQFFEYDSRDSVIRTDDTNTDLYDGPPTNTAWGQPTQSTDYVRYGYRGEYTTGDDTDLRHRTYDPDTGQFTSPDPLDGVDGLPTAASSFHYADNDPLNRTDPLGLRPQDADSGTPQYERYNFGIPVDPNHAWLGLIEVAAFIQDRETAMLPGDAGWRLYQQGTT